MGGEESQFINITTKSIYLPPLHFHCFQFDIINMETETFLHSH